MILLECHSMHPLIDCEELGRRLGEVRLFDIRWSLADPAHGRASYMAGHIPGAVFVDLDHDLAAPASRSGRHPLPPVEQFADTLGRLGIGSTDEVVVYDDAGGAVAARLWWMLRSVGHDGSRLLDGGYQAWVQGGNSVETGERAPVRTVYPRLERFAATVGWEDLAGRTVIDARAPERFRGENEPIDPKAGHIPGAINIPFSSILAPDGRVLDAGALADLYSDLGDRPVVSCGSGVNACLLAVSMVVAGRDLPDVYVGSFSEWSRRDLPVETTP